MEKNKTFLQSLYHEHQHLTKFEEPGDHTHHDESRIEGYEDAEGPRFGMRMGRGFDRLLSEMSDADILDVFALSPEQMQAYVDEHPGTPPVLRQYGQPDTLTGGAGQERQRIDAPGKSGQSRRY